eukprot:scaffold85767_cov23-Tisochrysis_lutea.AAC.1
MHKTHSSSAKCLNQRKSVSPGITSGGHVAVAGDRALPASSPRVDVHAHSGVCFKREQYKQGLQPKAPRAMTWRSPHTLHNVSAHIDWRKKGMLFKARPLDEAHTPPACLSAELVCKACGERATLHPGSVLNKTGDQSWVLLGSLAGPVLFPHQYPQGTCRASALLT